MPTRSPASFSRLKPMLRPAVRYRREREGAVLFDGATLAVYATSKTGLVMLRRMDGRSSCGQILEHLRRRFPSASRRTLRQDLSSFLRALENVGLVELQA